MTVRYKQSDLLTGLDFWSCGILGYHPRVSFHITLCLLSPTETAASGPESCDRTSVKLLSADSERLFLQGCCEIPQRCQRSRMQQRCHCNNPGGCVAVQLQTAECAICTSGFG